MYTARDRAWSEPLSILTLVPGVTAVREDHQWRVSPPLERGGSEAPKKQESKKEAPQHRADGTAKALQPSATTPRPTPKARSDKELPPPPSTAGAHDDAATADTPKQLPKPAKTPSTSNTGSNNSRSVSSSSAAAPSLSSAELLRRRRALRIGDFVFLRNAKFDALTESPQLPRYWVARVIEPQMMAVTQPPLDQMGRLWLQWFKETGNRTGLYRPTDSIFQEPLQAVCPLLGPMQFDEELQLWRRLPQDGSDGPAPALVYPGDEGVIAASEAEWEEEKGDDVAPHEMVEGAFVFMPNPAAK